MTEPDDPDRYRAQSIVMAGIFLFLLCLDVLGVVGIFDHRARASGGVWGRIDPAVMTVAYVIATITVTLFLVKLVRFTFDGRPVVACQGDFLEIRLIERSRPLRLHRNAIASTVVRGFSIGRRVHVFRPCTIVTSAGKSIRIPGVFREDPSKLKLDIDSWRSGGGAGGLPTQ